MGTSKRELVIEALRDTYVRLNGPQGADNYVESIKDVETHILCWSYNHYGKRSRRARYNGTTSNEIGR